MTSKSSVKLTFDPTNIDDAREVQHLLAAGRRLLALDAIYNKARSVLKYSHTDDKDVLIRALDEIKHIAAREVFSEEKE